ncbi:MAG: S8 family serine peptidase, partial [Lachnospirales bacterium]
NTNTKTAFSGRGNTTDFRIKPDIVSPGVNININNSSYTGTSFATPIVSGCAALLMEWGIVKKNDLNLYGEKLKAYLRLGAEREGNNYPNREFGYGKLCLRKTYSNLISFSALQLEENPAYSNNYTSLVFTITSDLMEDLREGNRFYCVIESGNYVVAYYDRREIIANPVLNNFVKFFTESQPIMLGLMDEELNLAAGITKVQEPPLNLTGLDIAIGFVDTGIDYKNPEFIYENGDNKIESIWDMTIENEKSEGVCFGRVFTNQELTEKTANTGDEIGHGTKMAKEACGIISGAAPDSTIIAVKLKKAKDYQYEENFIPKDAVAYSSVDVMLGIDFVIKEANRINKPLVLVLGIGTNEGGHNNSTILERYLSKLAQIPGIIVVAPTGNEAVARHHTSFLIEDNLDFYDIELNVAENLSGFKMWIWNNILDRVEIGIISPIGETISRIPVQNNFSNEYTLFRSNTKVLVEYSLPVIQTTDQRTTLTFTKPVSGLWVVRVYGNISSNKIHSWLQISNFIGSKVVFSTPDPYTTITTPSTADDIICVGGYNPVDNSVLQSSGRGPDRKGNLLPNFIAPTNSTTSISAAVTAGAMALLMQWGIINDNFTSLYIITATALIISSTTQNPNNVYPNNIEGYGRLNLYNVFNKLT